MKLVSAACLVWSRHCMNKAIKSWWKQAQAWPYFKSGLRDLVTEAEMAEMRTHGPKIRDGVAAHLARLRSEADAAKNAT